MPEKLLDDEERGLVHCHIGTYGVADGMRGYSLGYPSCVGIPLDYVAHGAGGEGFVASSFTGRKEWFAGIGVGGQAASGEEDVALDEAPELRRDWDRPDLGAFAHDSEQHLAFFSSRLPKVSDL